MSGALKYPQLHHIPGALLQKRVRATVATLTSESVKLRNDPAPQRLTVEVKSKDDHYRKLPVMKFPVWLTVRLLGSKVHSISAVPESQVHIERRNHS
jgi:hypothetical protein